MLLLTMVYIYTGTHMVWESYKLDPYVQRFAEQVFQFSEKVEDLMDVDDKISLEVRSLDTCQYNHQTFADIIGKPTSRNQIFTVRRAVSSKDGQLLNRAAIEMPFLVL